jgi:hypothetical protein
MKSTSLNGSGMTVSVMDVFLRPTGSRQTAHTFSAEESDHIVAKKTLLSSEQQNPVQVTSLNWVRRSNSVAHLLVSFLNHHVE